jgi:hypothetical protein
MWLRLQNTQDCPRPGCSAGKRCMAPLDVVRARDSTECGSPVLTCFDYLGHRRGKIMHDKLSFDTDDAIASPRKLAIPTRVRAPAPSVIAAINFNDQPNGWRQEIHDEAEQRHLAPKRNAEPT